MYHSTQSLEQAKRYLEEARRHGLFVMQNMPSRFIENPKEWWENWVKELSACDNLAWWYIPEEKPAEKTRHISEAVKANDPRHRPRATYLAWNSEKVLGGFDGLLDMLIKSSYPTDYKQPRINVVSWVTNVRNAKWLSIACAELFGKNNEPTPPKLRFDHYTAIVAGSRGMAWHKWSGGATLRNDLLEEAKRFAWEMAGNDNPTPLGRAVFSEDVPQNIRVRIFSGPTESPSTYFYSRERDADIQKSWPTIPIREARLEGDTRFLSGPFQRARRARLQIPLESAERVVSQRGVVTSKCFLPIGRPDSRP